MRKFFFQKTENSESNNIRDLEVGSPSESKFHNRFFINGKLDIPAFETFYDSNPNVRSYSQDEKVAALEYCRQIGLLQSFWTRRGRGIIKTILVYLGIELSVTALLLILSSLMNENSDSAISIIFGLGFVGGAASVIWLWYCIIHGLYKEYEYGKQSGRARVMEPDLRS